MHTILITGGAGYIGSHTAKLFLEKGFSVVILDNFSRGYHEATDILAGFGTLSVEEGDLLDQEWVKSVFSKHQIDTVLHFAALCLIHESIKEPERYITNNVEGTRNLLEAMHEFGVKHMIFSSTCAVYGETRVPPVDESHSTKPVSPYGESKLVAERLIRDFAQKNALHFIIFRYFNVCGASQDGIIGDSKKPSQLLLQNAVRGALKIEPFVFTCGTVDTPDTTPIRDYIDVEDIAEAHFQGYEYLIRGGTSDVFNLGNGHGYSVKEILSEVELVCGTTIAKSVAEPRQGEYARIYADSRKAQVAFGFQPKKSLRESIESLCKWYAGHPQGYQR